MILADTSVWSETTKPSPAPSVIAWLTAHHDQVVISAITVGELLTGLALMPAGRRRDELTVRIDNLIARSADRTYAYDERAARALATIRVARIRAGRPVHAAEDLMIAAIASAHGFAVATRNVPDFEGFGLTVLNPWEWSQS